MKQEEYKPVILVAEDDDSNIKLIKAIIGRKTEVLWAQNGQVAVELYKENKDKIEAILMDIKMPEMNGLEATREIRTFSTEVPIIMQTAYAFDTDRQNALDVGANEVLVKPIMSSVLKKCLTGFLPKLTW